MENISESITPKVEEAAKDVKIGALYPLTGPGAVVGKSIIQALELATEIINNHYDLNLPLAHSEGLSNLNNREIKLIIADTKGDPVVGQREAIRLIEEEGVAALIGAYDSNVTELASIQAEALKVPFVTPSASAHSLTQRGFKWFFRTQADDIMYTKLIFDFFKYLQERGKGVSPLAILSDNSLTSIEADETELNFIRRSGYSVDTVQIYSEYTKSILPEIEHIKNSEAKVMLVQQQLLSDAVWTVRIMRHLNFFPDGFVAQDAAFAQPEFIEILGSDSDYIISRLAWSTGVGKKKELAAEVNRLYFEKYGTDLNDANAREFTGLFVLAAAINSAGSTNNYAIRDALRSTNIPGSRLIMPWQGVRFDRNGQNIQAAGLIAQIVEGKYKIVWPMKYAEAEVIWPAPPWIVHKNEEEQVVEQKNEEMEEQQEIENEVDKEDNGEV